MLRIADTATGRLVEIPTGNRHLLRICVHLPVIDTGIGTAHLRAPLVGDVLARTAELHGLQALTVLTTPKLPPGQAHALDRVMAALGIHPPATVEAHEVTGSPGAPADVHLFAHGSETDAVEGVRIVVGSVSRALPDETGLDGSAALEDRDEEGAEEGADPLALRMLLLGQSYSSPVTVTRAGLAEARRALRHWRQQVADWAQEPSRPIPADLLRQAHAALADDLGVPAVLDMLVSLERDVDVPAGAKFETFAHLDRVLGLDLAREVGHQHRAMP
ncbi:hypothetical protein [Streptomyces sp. NPDC005408]|uniref:hypothetical protein n=1 Tax=Streptomyces sp. NPDC005408 TaxID=3155341 RepID=UPI0033A14506